MKRRLTKRRIALIQIEQSHRLFVEGDFVSALTLAGAAEEICGRIAQSKGGESLVGAESQFLDEMMQSIAGRSFNKKEFVAKVNAARNHLKHADIGNVSVEVDFEDEAKDMICRALNNYRRAFNCLPANAELKRLFDRYSS